MNLLLLGIYISFATGQVANDNQTDPLDTIPGLQQTTEMFKKLGDWDQHGEYAAQAIQRMFDQNGWNSPSHHFARDMALELERIPPWQVKERLDFVMEQVQDRYDLPDGTRSTIQMRVLQEGAMIFLKHGKTIAAIGAEAIETRSAGIPFTPEQVARWTNADEPIVQDAVTRLDRMIETIRKSVPSDKLKLFEQDVSAGRERRDFVLELREKFKRGGFQPEDLGLQNDPIQMGLVAAESATPGAAAGANPPPAGPAGTTQPTQRRPTVWFAHDPETWVVFVEQSILRYKFDAGQITTARSIHTEMVERARDFIRLREQEFAAIPAQRRATDSVYAPIRSMFETMRERIIAISTTNQRQQTKEKSETP